jgi:hypothetical protein
MKKEKQKGSMDISVFRRSCFAKRFYKNALDSPENLLHHHNHSWHTYTGRSIATL